MAAKHDDGLWRRLTPALRQLALEEEVVVTDAMTKFEIIAAIRAQRAAPRPQPPRTGRPADLNTSGRHVALVTLEEERRMREAAESAVAKSAFLTLVQQVARGDDPTLPVSLVPVGRLTKLIKGES